MNLTATTKDGVIHRVINNKWEPPIIVPANIHERALRNINGIRREREVKNDSNSILMPVSSKEHGSQNERR